MPSPSKPPSAEKELQRLEALCARSEQCESEILGKLRRRGLCASDAARVLESLKSRRFVDNARYASAFVRDKYRFMRWGRRKIAYALSAKGVSQADIEAAMDEIDADEYRTILAGLISARARVMGDEAYTYEGRTRLFRMAASRGYEADEIAAMVKKFTPK